MYGKLVTAPCGHPGEVIIGNFAVCLQGCDRKAVKAEKGGKADKVVSIAAPAPSQDPIANWLQKTFTLPPAPSVPPPSPPPTPAARVFPEKHLVAGIGDVYLLAEDQTGAGRNFPGLCRSKGEFFFGEFKVIQSSGKFISNGAVKLGSRRNNGLRIGSFIADRNGDFDVMRPSGTGVCIFTSHPLSGFIYRKPDTTFAPVGAVDDVFLLAIAEAAVYWSTH